MPQLLQNPKIQTKLKEDFPFTWRPRKRERPPRRRIIKSKLYSEDTLLNEDLEHMRGHPEDLRWLKTHVRPRFWPRFVSVANSRKPQGVPDIEDLISASTTSETALSILCAGAWDLDSDKDMQMISYRNGVGEMFLRRIFDACTNITAVTQWKSLDLEQLGQICIDSHDASQDQQKTQIIAQFDLKIKLTTHNVTTYTPNKPLVPLDQRSLHEDLRGAYRPHTYTVRLEKGMCCMPRAAYESMVASMYSQSYAYRLVFDKSPCPLRFGRTDTEEAPESLFLALAE